MKPYDPKLKAAVAEIRQVLLRYDVAGMCVIASGEGHAEYLNHIDEPTWSCLILAPPGIRFKAKVKSGPESERLKAARTVNMIHTMKDTLEYNFKAFQGLTALVHQHMDIDEQDGAFTHET